MITEIILTDLPTAILDVEKKGWELTGAGKNHKNEIYLLYRAIVDDFAELPDGGDIID